MPATGTLTDRPGDPRSRRRRGRPAALCCLMALAVAACQRAPSPAEAIADAQRLQQDGRATEAVTVLASVAQDFPTDASIRAELGRAQLAAGDASAAEGSLRRAQELGASPDDVVVPLVGSLLGQKQPQAALQLIGDPGSRPGRLLFPLSVLAAEAELALAGTDPRRLTRSFTDVFRLQAEQPAPDRDVRAASERLARLRTDHDLVRAAEQHFLCQSVEVETVRSPEATAVRGAPGRRVLEVGPTRELKAPSAAAAVARDGDVIAIDAGDYPGDVAVWRQSGLLLHGVGGRVRLDARGRSAADQGTWVFRGDDITVQGVEFSGARASRRNGSGIRFLGRNLTVRDSVFHDNEAGVLTWRHPEGDVLIEHSVFYRNGYGDGQSHNIYIGSVRSFVLRFSHSHDSHNGHEVKSRARTNHILYNRLTDEDDGDSSYLIDLPEGGDAYVVGNELLKGARSQNPHAVSYAAEAPDVASGQLWIVNNSFWNRYPFATFVRNASQRPATLVNNVVAGAPALLLKGNGEEITNYSAQRPGLQDPGQLDFTLTSDSPLIDAGTDPASLAGGAEGRANLGAAFEYAHPAAGRARRKVGPIDIGASEFCGW